MKATLLLTFLAGTALAADFPALYNSERDQGGPMPAEEAARTMTLPPGFKATVFAAEPEVQNPIAMAWDARGRLWVAENYTYAESPKKLDLALRDRILIFEDGRGEGRFTSRKVFSDTVQTLTSIEPGRGGVWAMCPPQLLFIPDANGDDVPDGAPQVVLDGFKVPPANHHNFANGLRFGPDGWLYGRCGHSAPGAVGAPGTPEAERIPLHGSMWRYHTERKIFEALSTGTTNPWGHDWDDYGELFFINTVNGHLWHSIPGAHFEVTGGNAHTYSLIDQHADHWHFDTAQKWTQSRAGAANAYGGGHAHVGAMIYLGGRWPLEYRGDLFTFNMHGFRANREKLERSGSGYVGRHGQDFVTVADKWFRGIELSYGPDGNVFAPDWSDAGECHESNGVHRTSGRIYRIAYGETKAETGFDLAKLSESELVELHTDKNEWFVRQARLALANRAARGEKLGVAPSGLRALFKDGLHDWHKLRALSTLYAIGAADPPFLRAQLQHENEHVRAWAVRLLTDTWRLDTSESERPAKADAATTVAQCRELLPIFTTLVRGEKSALVRLALASTLQRLPVSLRVPLAAELVKRPEDGDDHNLPLMVWYGLIPVAEHDQASLAKLTPECHLRLTRRYIVRRLAEDLEKDPGPLNEVLSLAAASPSSAFKYDVLGGLSEALTGWRKAAKPTAWEAFAAPLAKSTETAAQDLVRDLNVLFGDGRALDAVKKIALDETAAIPVRKTALQTLIDSRAPDLREICEKLLEVSGINPIAARGLATFDDPAVAAALVKAYRKFRADDRPQLLAALVSRPSFAGPLLEAIAKGAIPRGDLTPFHARQIRGFNDLTLQRRLTDVWGDLREAAADKREIIAKLKQQLTPALLAKSDLSAGRAAFAQVCAACHKLYGEGGEVGPDLTGTGRANLDYLLENVVDPSAVVTADFRMTVVNMKDGRVLNGFVTAKTDRTLTLRTMTEKLTLERREVTALQELPQSLMPEGLLQAFTESQVRDLLAYLMHPSQVPLPPAP